MHNSCSILFGTKHLKYQAPCTMQHNILKREIQKIKRAIIKESQQAANCSFRLSKCPVCDSSSPQPELHRCLQQTSQIKLTWGVLNPKIETRVCWTFCSSCLTVLEWLWLWGRAVVVQSVVCGFSLSPSSQQVSKHVSLAKTFNPKWLLMAVFNYSECKDWWDVMCTSINNCTCIRLASSVQLRVQHKPQ